MDHKEDFFLSEEAAEWVAQKKSEYLSELIMQLGPDDFGFEEFQRFDHLVPDTIQGPDRAYQDNSEDWPVKIFIRTYQGTEVYHQIVVGVLIAEKSNSDVFVPVLTFVTRKEAVVKSWARGIPLPRPILN